MKNFRFLALLGAVLVTGTLTGCLNNNTNTDIENTGEGGDIIIENTDTGEGGDLIIEDITDTYDAVIHYNDSLVEIAAQCSLAEESIPTNYEDDLDNIQSAIDNVLNQCQESINQINELGDREGDSSLREGIVKIIELDISYFKKFRELVPYLTSENLSEEDASKYESLVGEIYAIDQEMESLNNELVDVQSEFAKNHGYQLEEPTE